ncbi:MAG: pyridoxamine 5'-phosphate oxidase family protein [Magnetovibrio sp.]|nr:pyridoxamine 5'-phosphate oxidase family protein [Magnetovibrio sp.]
MATFFDAISEKQRSFIEAQHVFFVASAPLSAGGHVNVSPKGMDSFRVLGPNRVAYLDLTGSGNETSAHLNENGRITVMFCAFEGPPKIVRLFGTGRVVAQLDSEWVKLSALFPTFTGTRQIMVIEVAQTQDSCGMSVPCYEFREDRDALVNHWQKQGQDKVEEYWGRNAKSIDGMDAFPLKPKTP